MNPSEIGERTEAAILAALTRARKRVLKPFGEHRYDLAYEDDGRLVKVQCKTGVERNGAICFPTCSISRHGMRHDYREDADYFGVYCDERNDVYLVPVADVPSRLAHLRLKPARNGQRARTRSAEGYLLSRAGKIVSPVPQLPAYIDTHRYMREARGMATAQMELPVLCCAPLAASTITEDEAQSTAKLFKALADPHRVLILNRLLASDEPVCVCELNEQLDLAQPTVSFHLKKMVTAGLLQREKRATWAYYSVTPAAVEALSQLFKAKETV